MYKVGPRGRVRELPGGVDDVGLCHFIAHGLSTNIESLVYHDCGKETGERCSSLMLSDNDR